MERDAMRVPTLLLVILAGCATGDSGDSLLPSSTGPRPVARPPAVPFPDGQPEEVRAYLSQVYAQLQPWWHVALKKASSSYPDDHCVNNKTLEAEVVLRFEGDAARPSERSVQRRSGCALFDETVLGVFAWVRQLPPRPASLAREGRLVLRWRFFRDERGCEPAFANLEVAPYPPEEDLSRALARKDWARAREVIAEHRAPSVLEVLARVGLASAEPRVRRLALGIASAERVQQVLREDRSAKTWGAGVRALEAHRGGAILVGLLKEVAAAKDASDAARIQRVLDALRRLQHKPSAAALDALLVHAAPAVVLAGLELAQDATVLARARPAHKGNAGMTGALATRWCSLNPDPAAERAVRQALAGPGRTMTLTALERFPLSGLTKEVAELVRAPGTSAVDRVLAIRVLARLPEAPLAALYLALNAKEAEVQIAAAKALGDTKTDRRPPTYRLSRLSQRASGPVAAAALAAQARLGYAPFLREVLRRMRALSAEEQATVVSSLWGYGEAVVPELDKLARQPQLREAAVASLCRIPGDAARQACDRAGRAAAPASAPASQPGPLEQLLLLAGGQPSG
jgi:hypothetical protein